MKPGDLVRMKRSHVELLNVPQGRSFPLYSTPTTGSDTTDNIFLHENYMVLEVMFPCDPQITEVRLLTPRGTVGWNVGRYFEVISETR